MNEELLVENDVQELDSYQAKSIELDWTESEWFQVWLKLARQNHEESLNPS